MGVFEIRDRFYLDSMPFQVISGSIHYFRVVPEYWRDRLIKLKNMGCNTVETYIPWNYHEAKKGQFDFSGMRNVEHFVLLAQELGLFVILRPSPYICAEWEFGGLPAWLLKEDGIRLRCNDKRYLSHVMDYYDELLPRLVPLQITHGGPVIMMQVENEYGSYGGDKAYLAALRDGMRTRGIDVPLVTSDGPEHDMLLCGQIDGVFQTSNFGSDAKGRFNILSSYGISPLMCMEFWCGWFDHWGNNAHSTASAKASAKDLAEILERGHVNIYMFHGGTSFGLMNGSNDYTVLYPDVTSYDYDAPLSEDGRITEKYQLFKEVIESHLEQPVQQVDLPEIKRSAYGKAILESSFSLLKAASHAKSVQTLVPMSMERLDQDYGYTLYRTKLSYEQEIREIQLVDAADRAQIFLNGQPILTLYDRELYQSYVFDNPVSVPKGSTLEILVENMGRVNYSYKLEKQRKGIDHAVVINNHQHYNWEIIPLDERRLLKLSESSDHIPSDTPGIYTLTFDVDDPADTYLELHDCGKGIVFLNDFTLGRFWDIGPQKRLYIPAPLLKTGKNVLRVIETEGRFGEAVLHDEPDLG